MVPHDIVDPQDALAAERAMGYRIGTDSAREGIEALAERIGRLEHQVSELARAGMKLSEAVELMAMEHLPPSPDRLIAEGPLRNLQNVVEGLESDCVIQVRRYWEEGKAVAVRVDPFRRGPAIDEVASRFRAAGWKVEVEYPQGITFGTMTFSRPDTPA